jgi:type IV secretory pathway ATPase VirB11/archaellum biosynthesis ATPase
MSNIIDMLMEPLEKYIVLPNIQEIIVNEPLQICLELAGKLGWEVKHDSELTYEYWDTLCRVLANINDIQFQDIKKPRISTLLPGGHRIQATIGANTINENWCCNKD